MTKLTRRTVLNTAASAAALSVSGLSAPNIARASAVEWQHGLSLFGNLKYPAGFRHFGYVNPNAPKGGLVRMYQIGSFDSFNPFTFKGDPAALMSLTFDTLFTSSLDEPSTMYGLIASHAKHAEDHSWVSYKLDERARFHDGSPVTPEDVIWSMSAIKSAHPQYQYYYNNVAKAEQTGEREVTFRFTSAGNRELPHITAQLVVLPKHWWDGTDKDGKKRDIKKTTLEVPLGNGAYRIKDFKTSEWIVAERVKDYWAKDLPVNVGQNNFDLIRQIYFRDQNVAQEAFRGDQYDWRVENNSKVWATQYDFPAVKKGKVIVEKIATKGAQGMQAFVFNIRRSLFKDRRVREALNLAFDFEWSNKNLFFGQYSRTDSFFEGSELAATGLPGADELALLNPLKGQIPDEVFTKVYKNPVHGSATERRQNLRRASQLLRAAGWKPGAKRVLHDANGNPFKFEITLVSAGFERIVLPFAKQLRLLGIVATVRTIDQPQYIKKVRAFDYDCVLLGWGQSLSPGNEQRNYWSSAAADRPGSRNYVGIKDKAVDALIDKIIFAKSRNELVAACRALDRVLLWNRYVLPTWHIPYERTARWDRFGRPDKLPDYSIGFPAVWWWDAEKAAKVKA